MLYFKFFSKDFKLQNEETLYVIFSYMLDFSLYVIFWIFKTILNYKNVSFL